MINSQNLNSKPIKNLYSKNKHSKNNISSNYKILKSPLKTILKFSKIKFINSNNKSKESINFISFKSKKSYNKHLINQPES